MEDKNREENEEILAKLEFIARHQRMNDGLFGYLVGIILVAVNSLILNLFELSLLAAILSALAGIIAGYALRRYIYSHRILPQHGDDEDLEVKVTEKEN